MNLNIKTFNNWAIKNKDIAMQEGHSAAVEEMIQLIESKTDILEEEFSFLDIGCGNGWIVEKISKFNNCKLAEGIDGAPEMIKKAKSKDTQNNYYVQDIESWEPNKKYDIIFSMEVFYYFKDPEKIINTLTKYLNKNGILIIGIDHYAENIPSLNWDKEYNIVTNTFFIKEWKSFFEKAGLSDISITQYGIAKDWLGTLILLGNKKT